MLLQLIAILPSALLASSQDLKTQVNNSMKPFQLRLVSANTMTNDTSIAACHTGAAMIGLCWLPALHDGYKHEPEFLAALRPSKFYYNATWSTQLPLRTRIDRFGPLPYDFTSANG